jgi:hypothetical protein
MLVEKLADPVLSRRGRQWATLVVLGLLTVDVLVTGLEVVTGNLVEGRSALLDIWDTAKVFAIAAVSIWTAGRLRSRGLAIFAAVFVLIGVEDLSFWHGRFGRILSAYFDFGFLPAADSSAWGEFLALTAVAALGGILAWTVSDRWPGYRTVRRHLTLMLVVLFFFATVADLIADASGQNPLLTLIEETGERFTLSMIGGYMAGLGYTTMKRGG